VYLFPEDDLPDDMTLKEFFAGGLVYIMSMQSIG